MSNDMNYKGYTGSIECSVEDGCLHGKILFIDDLITFEGDTVPGIRAAFEAAVDRYMAYCEKTGKPANKPYSGTFQVRIGADLHKMAAEAAVRDGIKLNEYVTNAVSQAVTVSAGIHINHHHDHAVTVTVQPRDDSVLSMIATGDKPPRTWHPLPPSRH